METNATTILVPGEQFTEVKSSSESHYKYAFLFLIFFLVGFISGIYFSKNIVIERYLKDATTIGGIVINNVPYDLKGR